MSVAADEMKHFHEIDLVKGNPLEWKVVHSAAHGLKEHINITEGRALLHAIHHRIRSGASLGKRLLFLVDNMALCLAVNKGRSSKASLKGILREIASISLATGCKITCRWIPSELNVADKPSRLRLRRQRPFKGLLKAFKRPFKGL